MKKNILTATNPQKALNAFLEHPYTEYIESEIQKITGMSRAGVNFALRDLVKANYIIRELKGKTYFYSLQRANPVVKQLKVLANIRYLLPLISKLKQISDTVILYGSSARGEDHEDSDLDLFLVSHNKEEIFKCINKFKSRRKIQSTVKTTLDYEEIKKADPYFYNEINSGIVIWEAAHAEGI